MGAPVLVDDGGSIRIKLAKKDPNSAGVMDSLFDIKDGPPRYSEHEIDDPQPYTKALLLWLDKDGNLNKTDIPAFQTITIATDFALNVEAKILGGGAKLKLRVYSDALNPIVESKQHKKKRSYTFVNGGRIRQVVADNPAALHDIPDDAIYTGVVIT